MSVEKKKILILGGTGMLGHKLYQCLSSEFDVRVTVRKVNDNILSAGIFPPGAVAEHVDAFDLESVRFVMKSFRPDIVINCVGIIKQLSDSKNHKISIYINSLFPHLLAELCVEINARFIHISTDCVFTGKRGNYKESDQSDAEDLYGRSKYLGEVHYSPGLTLRTSIIGHELFSSVSLVDWFLSKKGTTVSGYTNARYSGFPTVTFAGEVKRIITLYPELTGLYQISSDPISKYELLHLLNNIYHTNTTINPDEGFVCDRSLDSDLYRKTTGFHPKSWNEMINEMYNDYLIINYYKQGKQ